MSARNLDTLRPERANELLEVSDPEVDHEGLRVRPKVLGGLRKGAPNGVASVFGLVTLDPLEGESAPILRFDVEVSSVPVQG